MKDYFKPFHSEIKEEDMITIDEIKQLPYAEIKDRKLSKTCGEYFRVRQSFNQETGEVDAHYYPITVDKKLISYKVRELPKNFYVTDKFTGQKIQLFGQAQAKGGTKKLLITGGELDALAAYDLLVKYRDSVTIVSLPQGENVKAVSDNIDFVKKFEEVIVCTDMDEPGRKCAKDIADLLGPQALIMDMSEKDACDMLIKGKQKEFVNAYFKAKVYVPEGFVTVEDVYKEATAMPVMGKSWPWPSLTRLTYGRRLGEGAYFGAGVKMGKSEAVNQITHHITQVEGGKVAIFKLEEKPAMTVRKIAGKIMHKQFHIPDGDFTHEELIDGVNRVKDTVLLYDSYMATSWDDIKPAIRHAVIVEGCQDVIIDPLTALTIGMESARANTELERIAGEIAAMSKELGFFYYFFCHLKAPSTGRAHEEGGKVHSNQFAGSRAMMRACYFMIGIERDKTLECDIQRNTSTFILLEDRAFGNYGRFDVFYDRATGDYLEVSNEYS